MEWSSWAFGLAAIVYIVVAERRVAHERRRLRRVAGEIEPSHRGDHSPVPGTWPNRPPGHGDGRLDDRLRSVLIQVGVDALPFGLAVDRSRRFNVARHDVEDAARALRASKLLRFAEPLSDSTTIRLT